MIALLSTSLIATTIPAQAYSPPEGNISVRQEDALPRNPEQGQYNFLTSNDFTQGVSGKNLDSYERIPWDQVEPSPGKYDFSRIERGLKLAKERGGTYSFRIMPLCTGCSEAGSESVLPPQLERDARTWTLNQWGKSYRAPDWNSYAYKREWGELQRALGKRFNGHGNLGYVDAGGYGDYGEGHTWGFGDKYPLATRQTHGSATTVKNLGDATIRAFPDSTVLWNLSTFIEKSDGSGLDHERNDRLLLDMAKKPQVGFRYDCLGCGPTQRGALESLRRAEEIAVKESVPLSSRPSQVWKKAPVVTEWGNGSEVAPMSEVPYALRPQKGSFSIGEQQVRSLHVSQLSSGNFKHSYEGGMEGFYSSEEMRTFASANSSSGYRYSIDSLGYQLAGQKLSLQPQWINQGVAPTYRNWKVTYSLVGPGGATVSSVSSPLDLQAVLPGAKKRDSVQMTLPSYVPSGDYQLKVSVTDQKGAVKPMDTQLAGEVIADVRIDGYNFSVR